MCSMYVLSLFKSKQKTKNIKQKQNKTYKAKIKKQGKKLNKIKQNKKVKKQKLSKKVKQNKAT